MKTIKDHKKFGWNKYPKNKYSKKGYINYSKEFRKYYRKYLKYLKHQELFRLPIEDFIEINKENINKETYNLLRYYEQKQTSKTSYL